MHIIFLLPHPSEEGSDREAWWVPDIQSRSAHQKKSRKHFGDLVIQCDNEGFDTKNKHFFSE